MVTSSEIDPAWKEVEEVDEAGVEVDEEVEEVDEEVVEVAAAGVEADEAGIDAAAGTSLGSTFVHPAADELISLTGISGTGLDGTTGSATGGLTVFSSTLASAVELALDPVLGCDPRKPKNDITDALSI